MGIKKDLTGELFGKLTVLQESHRHPKSGVVHWSCQCLCGKIFNTSGLSLRAGRVKSCGATKCRPNNNGYEDISRGYFSKIKTRAKEKELSFTITIQQIWDLFIQQDKKCYITGEALTLYPGSRKTAKNYQSASLDRIDSSKGYEMENVAWVHKRINAMKLDMSLNEFVAWCNRVTKYKNESK